MLILISFHFLLAVNDAVMFSLVNDSFQIEAQIRKDFALSNFKTDENFYIFFASRILSLDLRDSLWFLSCFTFCLCFTFNEDRWASLMVSVVDDGARLTFR